MMSTVFARAIISSVVMLAMLVEPTSKCSHFWASSNVAVGFFEAARSVPPSPAWCTVPFTTFAPSKFAVPHSK